MSEDSLPPVSLEEVREERASDKENTWRNRSARTAVLQFLRRIEEEGVDIRSVALVAQTGDMDERGEYPLLMSYGGDISNVEMTGMVAHMMADLTERCS